MEKKKYQHTCSYSSHTLWRFRVISGNYTGPFIVQPHWRQKMAVQVCVNFCIAMLYFGKLQGHKRVDIENFRAPLTLNEALGYYVLWKYINVKLIKWYLFSKEFKTTTFVVFHSSKPNWGWTGIEMPCNWTLDYFGSKLRFEGDSVTTTPIGHRLST